MIEEYLHNCLYFTVSALSRAITRMAEEEFRVTGLSPTYAYLIMVVNERPGIGQKELGEILRIQQSTVTRFIDKLEGEGLVERRISGKNSFIHTTEKGRAMQKPIEKAWESLYNRYVKDLGARDAERLTRLTDLAGSKLE